MKMKNISGKIAYFRDTILESEKDYVKKLKKNPRFNKTVKNLNETFTVEELYKIATDTMNKIELGQVKEKDLKQEEFFMLASVSAIVDLQKTKTYERVI